jgi:hypothetical protein
MKFTDVSHLSTPPLIYQNLLLLCNSTQLLPTHPVREIQPSACRPGGGWRDVSVHPPPTSPSVRLQKGVSPLIRSLLSRNDLPDYLEPRKSTRYFEHLEPTYAWGDWRALQEQETAPEPFSPRDKPLPHLYPRISRSPPC